jgi:hypothetical protein
LLFEPCGHRFTVGPGMEGVQLKGIPFLDPAATASPSARGWRGFSHPNAGQQSAILYTIIENCRLNDIDPVEYLEDVLPRIQDHPKVRVCELLPRQWKAAREKRAA